MLVGIGLGMVSDRQYTLEGVNYYLAALVGGMLVFTYGSLWAALGNAASR